MMERRPRVGGDFELFSWFFMRISGALLIFLVAIHIAFVHFINGVDQINFAFVAKRWATPTWRTIDIIMLALAMAHGGNGIRILIDDYVRTKGWRTAALSGLYTVGFVTLVLGALVILTFKA